ncbi:hypothetical protein QAD02_003324 [Eretmocerus hayati]|uniref:Uncharacterized protein n=1 Tax=Eretmocerus hayati TaxID=131215 RepID=A0ACC2NLI9_9HYME|nr:hypothetical protein QAD02_003324 [Eretmocerus hayati]
MGSLKGAVSDCIPGQNYPPSVPIPKHVVKYPPNETGVGSLDTGQSACPDRYSELRGQFQIVPLEIIAACPDVRLTDCSLPLSTNSHATPLTVRTHGLGVNVTELLVVDVRADADGRTVNATWRTHHRRWKQHATRRR